MNLSSDLQVLIWRFAERRYFVAFGHEDAGVKTIMSTVEVYPEVARRFTLTCHRMGWNPGRALAGPIVEQMQTTMAEAEAAAPGVSFRKKRGNSDRRRVRRAKAQAAGAELGQEFPGGEPPEPYTPVCRLGSPYGGKEEFYAISFEHWPDGSAGDCTEELGRCTLDKERFTRFLAGAKRRGLHPGQLMAEILNAGMEAVLDREDYVQEQHEAADKQVEKILAAAPEKVRLTLPPRGEPVPPVSP